MGTRSMIIVGIDPGNVTGVALWAAGEDEKPGWHEIPADDMGAFLRERSGIAALPRPVYMRYEKFTIMPNAVITPQPDALEVTGVVKDFARQHWIPLSHSQPRTSKKNHPDALLRKLGWYVKTKDGHASDAMRQVLAEYLSRDPAGYLAMTEPAI